MNLPELADHINAGSMTDPFIVNPRTPFELQRVRSDIAAIRQTFDLALQQLVTTARIYDPRTSDITPLTWHVQTESFARISQAISQAQAATAFTPRAERDSDRIEPTRQPLAPGTRVRITGNPQDLYTDNADDIAEALTDGETLQGTLINAENSTHPGWYVDIDDYGRWWIRTTNLEAIPE